jgi:mono/diheme cytochrome c family protein
MALSIGLLFVSSAGWWFVHKATQDAGPEVSSVLELKGDLETGRAVYQRAGCAGCHGAQGNGGVGPSLRDSRFVYQNTPVTIARQVRSGGGTMPAFGTDRISDQELASLIVFIRNWYSQ